MPFTNGSLYGKLDGQSSANNTQSAFNSSNTNNPNEEQASDIFQILAPGGAVLLNVTAAYGVNTSPASPTKSTVLATVQMSIPAYNSLSASPSAAQICAAMFPINYNQQQLDIFQIESDVASGPVGGVGTVLGGGAVIFRLTYAGAAATS